MQLRLFPPILLLLGAALCPISAIAQPDVPLNAKTPTFSVAELEQFLGGRTLLRLDLKDATLEQVAAALSQAANQKIEPQVAAKPRRVPAADAAPLAPPLYNLSASKTPFWETLRAWQLSARREADAAQNPTAAPVSSFKASSIPPNSLGLRKTTQGWQLQPDSGLADGRAVAVWPFLLVATDIKRNQDGSLNESGLREFRPASTSKNKAGELVAAPIPAPQIERWRDRLMLSGKVLVDPKLLPAAMRCEILEARDEKGNDLHFSGEMPLRTLEARTAREVLTSGLDFASGENRDALLSGTANLTGAALMLQIPLQSRPTQGSRLVKLRGVLRFNVVTRTQHWETTELDKPNGGTVFQNGGEFNVQFTGLEKNDSVGGGNFWSANFQSKSSGGHLERLWSNQLASASRNNQMKNNHNYFDNWGSTSGSGGSIRSAFGLDVWGDGLSFEGAPPMRLTDENGAVFESFASGYYSTMQHTTKDGTSTVVPSDLSPLPPDIAQNWSFDEKSWLLFRGPYTPADAATKIVMGKPAKLSVDLPLERREVAIPFEFTDLPLPPS